MKLFRQLIFTFGLFLVALFGFCLPDPLFQDPVSDVIFAADSTLLGARLASDGQWRFPEISRFPEKIEKSIVLFEDKHFFYHPGIDPAALVRAFWSNFQARRIVSGGSTLTMQLIRLSRKGKPRIWSEKLIEVILATRLELSYSKNEILSLYLSHAPFGGNVVGAEAAAWRYFGHSVNNLSWAESATLAVLPNAPALIHPGRNRDKLKKKRDKLLLRMWKKGILDEEAYLLSIDEPLPDAPKPLPMNAPHLQTRLRKMNRKGRIYTTIDPVLQQQVLEVANRYAAQNRSNMIYNMAILVADIQNNHTIAYVGNPTLADVDNQNQGLQIDMVTAHRSTGSLLKPLLYAGMLDAGQLLPASLVPDIPLYVNGFSPQNYNKEFRGAVHADEAISRSLNVPLVRMLMKYDYSRFYDLLKKTGMNTLYKSSSHYGLSLILGGAEGSLWNMTGMYASLVRMLIDPDTRDAVKPFLLEPDTSDSDSSGLRPFTRSALWFAFEAMSRLNRPEEEADWQVFRGMKQIAWKTGTSYGARDAWAIGVTSRYAVGVWVGNASGEGRAGLSGVGYAAPVLFDVFSFLPASPWFVKPEEEMREMAVCRESGFRAGPYCAPCDTLLMPPAGLQTDKCPFHHQVLLDQTQTYRVNADCYSPHDIVSKNWFTLPPAQEWYFRHYNAAYQPLPPVMESCGESDNKIDLIYPRHNMRIYLPVGFSGEQEKFVFKAAHSRENAVLFWHLNETYYGETSGTHQLAVTLAPGQYILTLVDETGYSRKISFSIVGKTKQLL